MSDMGTYARSVNAAAQVVSGQNTTDESVKDVAATVIALAEKLYKYQVKSIASLDITEDSQPRSKNTGQPYSGSGGSGSSGLTDNQRAKLVPAIEKLGEATPYTLEDIENGSTSGGRDSERSTMIGKVFDAAYGGR